MHWNCNKWMQCSWNKLNKLVVVLNNSKINYFYSNIIYLYQYILCWQSVFAKNRFTIEFELNKSTIITVSNTITKQWSTFDTYILYIRSVTYLPPFYIVVNEQFKSVGQNILYLPTAILDITYISKSWQINEMMKLDV